MTLWSEIQQEALTTKPPETKQIVVIGGIGCGKSSLIQSLTQQTGIYVFYNVMDEQNTIGRLGFYEMDSPLQVPLESADVIILALDFEKPCEFLNELQKCAEIEMKELVVVCCKSDLVESLSDEQVDVIQQTLRYFCLEKKAALIYTCAHNVDTIHVLRDYLEHRCFPQVFPNLLHKPTFVERDFCFIPKDWDSKNKIELIGDVQDFQSVILPKSSNEPIPNNTFKVESEIDFFIRLYNDFGGVARSPIKKLESPAKESQVLQNFFQSLLKNNKPKSEFDVAKEIERMKPK